MLDSYARELCWFDLTQRVCWISSKAVFSRARHPLADHRAQEAGGPAGDLGKPDPWSCGRISRPTASGAHCRLHRQALKASEGIGPLLRRGGFDCSADCRNDGGCSDRRRHETHGRGLGGLTSAWKCHFALPVSTASMVGSRSVAIDRLRTNPFAPASIAATFAFFSSWTLRAISFSRGK